jgi:YbbR domain-containing protein
MIASLVLAFGLWVIAVLQSDPIQQRDFPRLLEVKYLLDQDVVITSSNSNQTALVTIRAPASEWDSLRSNDIEVIADLRGKPSGTYEIQLEGQLDEGIRGEIIEITPDEIDVSIEQLISRRIPVRVVVVQPPPSGYAYPPPTCSLSEVTARGPANSLENASVLARLDLSEERNPVTLMVSLQPTSDTGRVLDDVVLETPEVECRVEIAQREGVSELSVVPVVEGFPPAGYIYQGFDFTPKTVTVSGQPDAIRQLNGVVNTAPINLADATSDFERSVALILPPDVRLLPETQTIRVTVYIGTIQGSRQYEGIPVQVEKLHPTLEVELLPDHVTVFAVGPQPLLEALAAEDLQVVVDLSAVQQPGSYQISAQALVILGENQDELQLTVQPPDISVTAIELIPEQEPTDSEP